MPRRTERYELKSYEFRQEREMDWRELEALLARADGGGVGSLSPEELHRLPALYRQALSSLSVARSISLDRNVVEYLESLAARAYVHVYGAKREYGKAIRDFFTATFPALVWRARAHVLVSILVLSLGVLAGFLLTLGNPDLYYSFVPEGMAQGRSPLSSREELRSIVKGEEAPQDEENEGDGEETGETGLTVFASFLFTHNAQIGLGCFALGIAAGVPVALLLFYNGVLLGALAAVYHRVGLSVEFWGWVMPHGVTELLAVCLCGAAGFLLGLSWIFPGRARRADHLASQGRKAAAIVVGCVALFFLAGLIEGYFRQLVTHELPRYALVTVTALFWAWYLGVHGRRTAGREAAA